MYVVKTKNADPFEADVVTEGSRFPVLHIYTNNVTPIQAYQIFLEKENSEEILVEEYNYYAATSDSFEKDLVYYEHDNINDKYFLTEDETKDPNKTYYVKKLDNTVEYHDFTEIYAVQKAYVINKTNEILIWLQRPTKNYD